MVDTIICEAIIIKCDIDTTKCDILPTRGTIPTHKICGHCRITPPIHMRVRSATLMYSRSIL